MTQLAELIELMEDFDAWLTEMSIKYNIDKNTLQGIIKDLLN